MKVWLPRREQNIYKLFLKTRNSFLCVRACVSESVFCILGIYLNISWMKVDTPGVKKRTCELCSFLYYFLSGFAFFKSQSKLGT